MARAPFTEYDVRQLIAARKFVAKIMQDNVQSETDPRKERRIVYAIRRRDTPNRDISLRLIARLSPSVPGVGLKSLPGIALQWKGKIIRKLDWALRHDTWRDGVVVGFVRGWHEHIWTDEDEDRHIVEADPPIKRTDMRSLVRYCADKWNIGLEGIEEQPFLGE